MYVCILRFVDNTNAIGGDHQDMDGNMEENKMEHAGIIKTNTPKCLREEREVGAQEGRHDGGAPHIVVAPSGGS